LTSWISPNLNPVAAQLPTQIPIPGLGTPDLIYDRVETDGYNLMAGASYTFAPYAAINGPLQLFADDASGSATGVYHVWTRNLRPPLAIQWSATGDVLNQGSADTRIRFYSDEIKLSKCPVNVTVTDADHKQAKAQLTVVVHPPKVPLHSTGSDTHNYANDGP
jgi:WD40 repeat protein